jgi:hypothetical protein
MSPKTLLSLLALCLLIVSTTACTNGNAANTVKSDNKEGPCQVATIREFLGWYKHQYEAISARHIVSLAEENGVTRYKVDGEQAMAYITTLQSSGFFGDAYLNNQMTWFGERELVFSKSKQSDGVPVGFEADLLLATQEPETILEQVDTIAIKEVNKNQYKLTAIDHSLLFDMANQEGRCVINAIRYEKK